MAKRNKKNLIYQVKLGNSPLYDWCTESVREYADKIGVAYIQLNEPILKIQPNWNKSYRSKESCSRFGCLPILEKQNAFDHFDTYEKIAIIDADILVRDVNTTPNLFDEIDEIDEIDETDDSVIDFAGVLEHTLPITDKYRQKIRSYSIGQYSSLINSDHELRSVWNYSIHYGFSFWNMGMMLLNRTFRDYFISDPSSSFSGRHFWNREDLKQFIDAYPNKSLKWSSDQSALNYIIRKKQMNTKNLDWRWNTLYKAVDDEKIPEAHFVHFFLKDLLPDGGSNIKELKKVIGQ